MDSIVTGPGWGADVMLGCALTGAPCGLCGQGWTVLSEMECAAVNARQGGVWQRWGARPAAGLRLT
jgi:hypothetical protein